MSVNLVTIISFQENMEHHRLKGFGTFERELNKEFQEMIASVSVRLTEMCKIEKRVWRNQEEVIEKYDELMTVVDQRFEQQVSSMSTIVLFAFHKQNEAQAIC